MFRRDVFKKWNTKKVYDFTTLQDFLWGKTKVATIAVMIRNEKSNQNAIEHIIVRSSNLNHKGALRFQIDKYDRFRVPFEKATKDKYYWKTNLLGGGRLHFYVDKYLSANSNVISVQEYFDNRKSNGFRTDNSSDNQIDLKGMTLLDTESFINDSIKNATYKQTESLIRRNINSDISSPPNVLVRLNANYSIPIVYNNEKIVFLPGVLGLKGTTEKGMIKFVEAFKSNRELYLALAKILSSKIFIQQSGEFTIDAQDIMNLPLKLDKDRNPVSFDEISEMEKAVWEDTELLAQSINKPIGKIFKNATNLDIEQYATAFCEVVNYVYENGDYKFQPKRIVINENWVWVTFCHSDSNKPFETSLSNENQKIYNEILRDDISNYGLRINRVVTHINEPNSISFLKPRTLKFWTRSIGYRDAEEVKSVMLNNGY